MSEKKDGVPAPIEEAPVAPAGDEAPALATAPTDMRVEGKNELPDWLRAPTAPVPDASEQVVEGTAVAVPSLNVDVEPPVAPRGEEGNGGEPPAAPEPIKPPEPQKARYEDDLLRAIGSSKDVAAANIEKLTSSLGVSSLEPEERRILGTGVRVQRDLVEVDLSQLEGQAGLRQARLVEKEVQLGRITGLEAKINALGLESIRQEAARASELESGLRTTVNSLNREADEIDKAMGELTGDIAGARSERVKTLITQEFDAQSRRKDEVEAVLKEQAQQLAAAKKQAEEANGRLVCIEKAVNRFQTDMVEPKTLLATIEAELAQNGQVSAETQQKIEDLRQQTGQKETQLKIDDVLKDIEGLGQALADLDPRFVHQGGLQTDAMRAMSAQFAGPQLVDIHWVTRLENENRDVVGKIGLGGVLKQRAEQMNWLYQLAQSGSPEEMMARLVESGRVDLPETFRQTAKSVLETGKMPEVFVEGSPRELAEALEKRNELYLAVLNKFGVETAEQRSLGEAKEKHEAEQMRIVEGVAESIQEGEEAKQAAAKAEAEEAERQRLDQEARLEEQKRQAAYDQDNARFAGKESGLRQAETEAIRQSLLEEFSEERLPGGTEVPNEGQSVEDWRNEARRRLVVRSRANLSSAAEGLRTAREEANADAQREAANKLATAMVRVGNVSEMREEVARIYNETLDARPEGKDKKHDKGVADRMKEFADLLGGKMDVNKLAERLANTGMGPLRKERTDAEKEEIGEQVMRAEMKQVENIRVGGALTKEKTEEYVGKMKGLNAALEGAGILGAGVGSLLNAGFELAIQTMFGGK